ncbi:MAG: hypothetical protein J6K58_10425 [Lachnospiraceae bacterium]|nr:hypothetical protein [Lachnospiraceae bacterium]
MVLYELILCDNELSYDDHKEEFLIGIFLSLDTAKEMAEYYLNNIEGFKDYDCTYNILEKKIVDGKCCNRVWIIWGWDENEESDEIRVIQSECYANKQNAIDQMKELQKEYKRTNWCVDRYYINQCSWKEGFIRV